MSTPNVCGSYRLRVALCSNCNRTVVGSRCTLPRHKNLHSITTDALTFNLPAVFACLIQSEVLRNTPENEKEKVSKTMHRVMDHNQLFYCTNNEIVVGDMPKTDMGPIHTEASMIP